MAPQSSNTKGQSWFCTAGNHTDVTVDVDDMTFHLHKLPLISRSKKLHDMIAESAEIEADPCRISLPGFPGGSNTFEMAAKFCYGDKIEISTANAAALRCAGEVLEMTEDFSKDNLIHRTNRFLSRSVFRSVKYSIAVLKSCEGLMPMADHLGIVRCCVGAIRKECSKSSKHPWLEDLLSIRYEFVSRVVEEMRASEASSDVVESLLLHYAKKSFPGINRSNRKPDSYSIASEEERRKLLQSIVADLPSERCSCSSRTTRCLFGLLRMANILKASEDCKFVLERKIGFHLDRASLDDLLVPSYSYLNDTLYDIDCVGRILGHFMESYNASRDGLDEETSRGGLRSPPLMLVGKLMDGYLSEIASDANLNMEQFRGLGLALPDQARLFDDGLYRAVDLYIKAHPWSTEMERESICEIMDSQKLTLEACAHAAKNERLPLRVVVQVLFFEQVQLRNAIASTYMGEDREGTPIESLGRLSIRGYDEEEDERISGSRRVRTEAREKRALRLNMKSVKTRVHELERECSTMKKVIEKYDQGIPSTSRKSSLTSKFGCKFKTQVCDSHEPSVVEGRKGRYVTGHSHYRN